MIQNLISISPFFNCCLFPQHDKSPRNPPTSVRVLQSRSSKLAWGLKLLFLLMVHHGKNFNDFVPNILGTPRAQAVSSIDSSPPPSFSLPLSYLHIMSPSGSTLEGQCCRVYPGASVNQMSPAPMLKIACLWIYRYFSFVSVFSAFCFCFWSCLQY